MKLFSRAIVGTAVAALALVFVVPAGATDEPLPPDNTITVVKEVNNGPADATYVVEVTCHYDEGSEVTRTFTFSFGDGGTARDSDSASVPPGAATCSAVETQTNGAVVDIEGNDCSLPENTPVVETTTTTTTTTYASTEEIYPPKVIGWDGPFDCDFEVSNEFPTPETVPPEIIIQQVPAAPTPAPVIVRGPDFTG